MSCQPNVPMFNRFLDSATPLPLSAKQKFILAARNVSDPYNLLTIGGVSAISIMTDSHTADGPGFKGFAKNAGVSLSQDMTGEFFGTFLIPAITHQDPHYHRMPNLSVRRRILHVIDAVVISQSDQGVPMFNYSTVVGTICTNSLGKVQPASPLRWPPTRSAMPSPNSSPIWRATSMFRWSSCRG
jgi:hypothetical protein